METGASGRDLHDDDDVIEERVKKEEEEDAVDDDGVTAEGGKARRKLQTKRTPGVDATEASLQAAERLLSAKIDEMITWKEGEDVPYSFLVDVFEDISNESGRFVITEKLTNAFRAIMKWTPKDLLCCVYLASGTVAAPYNGLELGVGDAMLSRSVGEATGRSEKWIKSMLQEEGDLGRVAVLARHKQKTLFTPKPLTAARVLASFHKIASIKGERSVDEKRNRIKQLLVSCRDNEAGYIVRALQGKLKIGLAEQSVLIALGQAALFAKDEDEARAKAKTVSYEFARLARRIEEAGAAVKEAFSVCPSYDVLVPELLSGGTTRLNERIVCTIGVPVKCMLAKPTKGVQEVVRRFADVEFTCEYKYDGERAQVHVMEDGSARVFSRNAEDTTAKYPDVCNIVKRARGETATSIVVDGEVVAYNRATKRIEAFQKLSTRSKKDTTISDIKVTICYFAFDLLYLNGRPLLGEPLVERRRLLRESLNELEGECQIATSMESSDIDELQTFLDTSVRDGTEGLIVKTLRENATYEPSKRSLNWLKLKKDYIDNLGDSLDLVPIAAWYGKGKRTGVFGVFLLACFDDDTERYQTICKVGTGFSENMLVELSDTLSPKVVSEPPRYYDWSKKLEPDVWFEPAYVWEVKAADLSISPVHMAAAGQADDSSKGIALRFPRLIRLRDDKKPEMATTASQVLDMYRSQALVETNEAE